MDTAADKERFRIQEELLAGRSAFTTGMFTDQAAFYDERADIYDEQNEIPDRADRRVAVNEVYHSKLKKNLSGKNLIYLDFGCGTGTSTNQFLSGLAQYAEIEKGYALDISNEMVKIAKKNLPEFTVFQGTSAALNFENTFDLITSFFHVLCHLTEEELHNFFKNTHTALKTGGLLCFDVVRQFNVGEHGYTQADTDAGRKYLAYHSVKKDGSKVLSKNGDPMIGTDRLFTKEDILSFAKEYQFEAVDVSDLNLNRPAYAGIIREFLVILAKR